MVEQGFFELSVDDRVQFSRPSADVLFESAVDAYGAGVIGVVLTGANADGAAGLACIKSKGGFTIVQDPATADKPEMPLAAIEAVGEPDAVLPLDEVAPYLTKLAGESA
jgi:two-component system chemotaxis response regulator CheB